MAYSITPVAAKDGNQTTIVGGIDFVDVSGTGVGPWIITKVTIDPAGVNVQGVLSNSAAKTDLSSVAGTTVAAPVGNNVSGVAAVSSGIQRTNANLYLWNGATWDQAQGVAAGTAGTAATDVLTIQGIAGMTKVLVTPDSVALPANQSVNVAQINAVTPLMGNGVTGTGSARVTIASDNTAFAVNATLSAETSKVIGTVNQGTSPWVDNLNQWAGTNLSAPVGNNADAVSAVTSGVPRVVAGMTVWNGSTWDRAKAVAIGTAGSAAADVLSIQGIASMTPVQVSQAAAATGGYSFANITTDTTTTVKSGAGFLHTICVNTLAATGTIQVYDNTAGSGTKIALIGGGVQQCYIYDIAFATGLTIVTATAAPDITVSYK